MALHIDYTNMMGPEVGGLSADILTGASADFRRAYDAFEALRRDGQIGFADLPSQQSLLDQVTQFAALAHGKYDDVILLGIGGSALGPVALRTALRPSGWNMLSAQERGGYPRLHVLDNVDPETIAALLARLDLSRALVMVTSKSGGTVETMAQLLIVCGRLVERALPLRDHMVFVTDPTKGALRALAAREEIPALDIPENVGGRFSVLTPVGTLPAALMGIDVAQMLEGAKDLEARCRAADLAHNPAGLFATLQWLADVRLGRGIHVLMPYSDPLRDIAAWFVQLWAESLGKHTSDGGSTGPTPVAALGATDQHSQVQLFMEGPPNKTVTFVTVEERRADVEIPVMFSDVPELGYLGGHTLGELIAIEQRASAGALARRGRPNMTISLGRVDPWHIGGLFMLFELATAYAGQLYGVNAFDQPGVELGKQFAYTLLGRPEGAGATGMAAARAEWERLPKPDVKWKV